MSEQSKDSTLTEFLMARIADDEAIARAAVGEYRSEAWRLGDYDETVLCFPPSSPEKIAWNLERLGPERAAEHERWGGFTTDPDTAPHIARHDPARVLAECEAKRRIVEAYADAEDAVATYDSGDPNNPPSYWQEWGNRHALRLAVECLALPYADHPDYREKWKP